MTAQIHDHPSDPSPLPPPQPRDKEGTRPPLDLAHVIRQVKGIQTFLAGERAKQVLKAGEVKGEQTK